MWDQVSSSWWILVGGLRSTCGSVCPVFLVWLCSVNLFLPGPVLNVNLKLILPSASLCAFCFLPAGQAP